jgi:hypothetical protein
MKRTERINLYPILKPLWLLCLGALLLNLSTVELHRTVEIRGWFYGISAGIAALLVILYSSSAIRASFQGSQQASAELVQPGRLMLLTGLVLLSITTITQFVFFGASVIAISNWPGFLADTAPIQLLRLALN